MAWYDPRRRDWHRVLFAFGPAPILYYVGLIRTYEHNECQSIVIRHEERVGEEWRSPFHFELYTKQLEPCGADPLDEEAQKKFKGGYNFTKELKFWVGNETHRGVFIVSRDMRPHEIQLDVEHQLPWPDGVDLKIDLLTRYNQLHTGCS